MTPLSTFMKSNIVYSTIAIGDQYRKISEKLINSFIAMSVWKSAALHIFTDDICYYDKWADNHNIVVDNLHLDESRLPNFDLNIKSVMLDFTMLVFKPNYIVLHDCDMYFEKCPHPEWFDNLPSGVNVAMGEQGKRLPVGYFTNTTIFEKYITLVNGDSNYTFHSFREGCLILNCKDRDTFYKFTTEWQLLMDEVKDKGLVDCAQIGEICLASDRSGYPLHNLTGNPLQECFYYHERNGSVAPALR